jgi:methylated-DNA-[protein]-cysteine S-methyltransferase
MAVHAGTPFIASVTLASAWGPVVVLASGRGVLAVGLRGSAERLRQQVGERIGAGDADPATTPGAAERLVAAAAAAVGEALDGRPADLAEVPLDWAGVRPWDRRVLEGARMLARGEVTSYGRLARRIGAPGAARAVGAALGRNPFWILVPCHRIVAGDGSLGGYGDQPDALEIKRDLLALEGVSLPLTRLVD